MIIMIKEWLLRVLSSFDWLNGLKAENKDDKDAYVHGERAWDM